MPSPPGALPPDPQSFLVGYSGSNFSLRSQQKRATPVWRYSHHSTTLRFGALSSVAHTLMRYLDLTCELVSVQALPKHLHHLLPAFRVARFTRSAPHRHLLFQVTFCTHAQTVVIVNPYPCSQPARLPFPGSFPRSSNGIRPG